MQFLDIFRSIFCPLLTLCMGSFLFKRAKSLLLYPNIEESDNVFDYYKQNLVREKLTEVISNRPNLSSQLGIKQG